jgi:ACR3 family arsenite efflux pump ArsB
MQLVLLPVYLTFMLGNDSTVVISIGPFVEAFVMLIALPLVLAVATAAGAKRSRIVESWNNAWAWMPVPAMAAVLVVVIGAQISTVVRDIDKLLPVIPAYIGFTLLAPVVGALVARAFKLPASTGKISRFQQFDTKLISGSAIGLAEEIRGLAAAAVITQTLIELVSELIYIRAIPALVWRKM